MFDTFFDDVFDSLMRSNNFGYRDSFPATNVFTDSTGCTIELALAGYKREQLNVSVEGNTFTVSASSDNTKDDSDKKYHNHRVKRTAFKRIYTVPAEEYDLSALKATYVDGILTIFVPLKEKQIQKTIPIMIE